MKLAREVFDGGNDARRGAIDCLADDRETSIAHGIEEPPAGEHRERFEITGGGFGMGCREHEIVGLESHDFFKIHLGPVLRSVHDAGGVGFAKRIGDEGVFADGDKRAGPYDEENAARREGFEFGVKRGEASLEIGSQGFSGFRDTDEIGEFLRGGENLVDVLGARRVGRDAECIESAESVEPIDLLSHENKVGMEGGNFFEIRIDGAADLPFLLRVGRIVAVIRVPDEAILHAEGVKRFGQAGRERDDAHGNLRHADGASEFVHDFAHGGCRRRGCRRRSEGLGADGQGAEQEQG